MRPAILLAAALVACTGSGSQAGSSSPVDPAGDTASNGGTTQGSPDAGVAVGPAGDPPPPLTVVDGGPPPRVDAPPLPPTVPDAPPVTACTCGNCAEHDLGNALPAHAHGTLAGAVNRFEPTCGPVIPGLPDVAYRWTAPASGSFLVEVSSPGFAVVAAGTGDCPSRWPVECAQAGEAGRLTLQAGDVVTLVVSSDSAATEFDLSIRRVDDEHGACSDGLDNDGDGVADCADPDCAPPTPGVDLGERFPVDITDKPSGASHSAFACSGFTFTPDTEEDRVYLWTPPATARYWIRGTGTLGVSVLGTTCPVKTVDCPPFLFPGQMSPLLTAGVPVLIVVDADSDYRLEIRPNTACADADLGSTVPAAAQGAFDGTDDFESIYYPGAADARFHFTAPAAGTYRIANRAAVNSVAIALTLDGCAGPAAGTSDSTSPAHVDVALEAGQELFIDLEQERPGEAGYDLTVTRVP